MTSKDHTIARSKSGRLGNLNKSINQVGKFLREVRSELRKVVWPTRKETIVYTTVVVSSVVVVALIIWVMDSVLSKLMALVIR